MFAHRNWVHGIMLSLVTAFVAIANAQESILIRVDAGKEIGKIRRLHGTNLATSLDHVDRDNSSDLKELDIPLTRLHDSPMESRGQKLVDVSYVFPLFHSDPQDPKNYYFAQTDDYIQNCLNYGSKILYRLGESIDHSAKSRRTYPPKDYDKWADICINIIRHYNEGWAEGFHDNIEYWEIWNEADPGPCGCWMGTWNDYCRLYVTAAKKIKARFPNIKIGGPAMTCVNFEKIAQLLSECKRQNAPLDFFSWHIYGSSPEQLIASPAIVRKTLDKQGFTNTELHLNEWHYLAEGNYVGSREQVKLAVESMGGPDAAAYLCAALSGWQDTPLTMANYYTGVGVTWPGWGFYGNFGLHDRNKCYFAMKAFNLMTKYANRVDVTMPAKQKNVWTLAGRKNNGQTAMLISCFKSPATKIVLNAAGCKLNPGKCKVRVVDANHELTDAKGVKFLGERIVIPKSAGSAVFFVETE